MFDPVASEAPIVVDLFCGAGGLSRGLRDVGLDVRLGIDVDDRCRFAFEHNTRQPFARIDVRRLSADLVRGERRARTPLVLAGCAPCPTFSNYTQGVDKRRDRRWELLDHFGRLVRDVQPEIVTMENVPQIQKHAVFGRFRDTLLDLGFDVTVAELDCASFGVPQARQRVVLLASRFGPIKMTKYRGRKRTVRDAIASLPTLEAGMVDPADPLHRAAGLSPLNLRRIRASLPGGTWRDWPAALVSPCHRIGNGERYAAVYGRMQWDAPAPTLTTQCFNFGSGRFGHPEQDRAISLREAALLQSFPGDYEFFAPNERPSLADAGRMIGNAVPVGLGRAIGRSILKHLES
jgi:DNA (cytosine-5)-methyltransferase 1